MIEKPHTGRATITKNINDLHIEIPAQRNWFVIIFICFWLCGWLMGETFAATTIFMGDKPMFADLFLVVWLTLWTVGGGFAIYALLWMLIGVEFIHVDRGVIEIGRKIFEFKLSKKYDIGEIRQLQINHQSEFDQWGMNINRSLFNRKTGVLKFDYGMKTIKFANGIEEAEGRQLLGILKENSNFKEANFPSSN